MHMRPISMSIGLQLCRPLPRGAPEGAIHQWEQPVLLQLPQKLHSQSPASVLQCLKSMQRRRDSCTRTRTEIALTCIQQRRLQLLRCHAIRIRSWPFLQSADCSCPHTHGSNLEKGLEKGAHSTDNSRLGAGA